MRKRVMLWGWGGLLIVAGAAVVQAQEQPVDSDALIGIKGALEGLQFLAIVLLLKSAVIASTAIVGAVLPTHVDACRERLLKTPRRMMFFGLLDALALLGLVLLLITRAQAFPVLGLLALAVICVTVLAILPGLAGVYQLTGAKVLGESSAQGCGGLVRGGALVELAAIVPIAGWLAHGLMILAALGAGVISYFKPKRAL